MEPEQLLFFAERNKIPLPFDTVEQAKSAYAFQGYQSFIDAYIRNTLILKTEEDFYDLAVAYFKRAQEDGVIYAEISFDFQTYTPRGIRPAVLISGLNAALKYADKEFNIKGNLILNIIRNKNEESAFQALEQALPFRETIVAIGLASYEIGNPPSKFARIFQRAGEYGFFKTAHAGEVLNFSQNIREALDILKVDRIDHGVQVINYPDLLNECIEKKIGFTVCPLSNVCLGIYSSLNEHPLKRMLDQGALVSINSDDPAFFGGYIADNYNAAYEALGLHQDDIIAIAQNSLESSFASPTLKKEHKKRFEDFIKNV
jgi:adenosine deaminase